jgi:hypothetical protein
VAPWPLPADRVPTETAKLGRAADRLVSGIAEVADRRVLTAMFGLVTRRTELAFTRRGLPLPDCRRCQTAALTWGYGRFGTGLLHVRRP